MAERKISTKFELTGEAQYKQKVKEINNELKNNKAEMAKVSAQFATNANSMDALTAKGDILTRNQDAMKRKVSELQSAFADAKTKQGEWADKQKEAADKVKTLEEKLEALKKTEGDTAKEQEKLTKELEKAQKQQDYANRGYEAATRAVDSYGRQLNYAEADLAKANNAVEQNRRYIDEAKDSANGCATSIDRYGKAAKNAGGESEGMGIKSTEAFKKIATTFSEAGIIALLVKTAQKFKDIADEALNAEAVIARGTGASGRDLTEFNENLSRATYNTTTAMKDNAAALANLNTRFGSTGAELEDLTTRFSEFGRATGEDMGKSVDLVADIVANYGKTVADVPHILDLLTVATQSSGATVEELASSLTSASFYADAYGYSLEETLAQLAAFEKAGVKSATVSRAMGKSYDDLTSGGKTWNQLLKDIANGTITDAELFDLFDARSVQMSQAVKTGAVDIDGMAEALRNSANATAVTAVSTTTFGDIVRGLVNKIKGTRSEIETTKEVLDDSAALDSAMERLAEIATSTDDWGEAVKRTAEFLASSDGQVLQSVEGYGEFRDKVQELSGSMLQLQTQYDEAKKSIETNLNSLMGLFNEMDTETTLAVGDMISALSSQMEWMDNYAANLQAAASKGVDEGLLASLRDGSQQSAEILAGLAEATAGDIETLNAKWEETQKGRETFKSTLADIETDYSAKMEQMQKDFDEVVKNFNQSDQAYLETEKTAVSAAEGLASRTEDFYAAGIDAGNRYIDGMNYAIRTGIVSSPTMPSYSTASGSWDTSGGKQQQKNVRWG